MVTMMRQKMPQVPSALVANNILAHTCLSRANVLACRACSTLGDTTPNTVTIKERPVSRMAVFHPLTMTQSEKMRVWRSEMARTRMRTIKADGAADAERTKVPINLMRQIKRADRAFCISRLAKSG